ncbi:MAG: sigma 54-interacting transcriptional regulator, partial [Limnochordia bacterium]
MKGLSAQEPTEKIGLLQHVNALMGLLTKAYGPEELQAKAGRIGALHLMRSSQPEDRLAALEKVIGFDSPSQGELQARLDQLEEKITEILVRRKLEERLEAKITRRMQERQADYVKELTLEILREGNPDNAHTLKKYAYLQKLEARGLSRSALELMRPASLGEVVGQGQGIRSILSKLASPYPQHILIYGPPGVGKTTVARLALEHARQLAHTPFGPEAPFVEVDGTTIRWDPREATNPLLGSVHDPIYQGAKREMADGAIPEPKLGLVTEAHGGVLFIDEIGELEPILQNKLLKVLEDKRVTFESPYYDPEDPNIPKYIRHLFEKGAPADFVLIGATTRQP